MGRLAGLLVSLWAVAAGLTVEPAHAFIISGRWNRTATNSSTGSQGTPITLTWSFAPDGTSIPANTFGTVSSNLISFLDTNWGVGPGGSDLTQRPWFSIFEQSFTRISALAGVTYVYEPNDDGRSFANSTAARGSLGVRGDIRLGGKSYGSGSNTLASNYYPDYGEMMINTDQGNFFRNASNGYRPFRNTIMHEALHGLGINHVDSSSSGFLMEPILSSAFDGPQLDDILALHRLYGDVLEKNGGNDLFSRATPLGTVSPTDTLLRGTLGNSTVILPGQVDFLSIDDDSDTDFFSFSLEARWDVSLLLEPRGTTYQVGPQDGTQTALNTLQLSDLTLALFDTNGTSLLESANLTGAGGSESIVRQLLPGTYFARVKGLSDNVQLYQIGISASEPLPQHLHWAGDAGPAWDTGTTANFLVGGQPARFYASDHVRFDDSAATHQVQLDGDVSAGDIVVETSQHYVFAGSGGIVAGNLTVTGDGIVELANAGNSYPGPTTVANGTLAITGDANAMRTDFTVEGGAMLLMAASDAGAMTSTFTIQAGGTLQIGTPDSSGNVFPDVPTSIVNAGAVRVLATETLQQVVGDGRIEAAGGTTTLLANPDFSGKLAIRTGGLAQLSDPEALGSSDTIVEVETDGHLEFVGGSVVSQEIRLAPDASLALSPETQFALEAKLIGEGLVSGSLVMPGTIIPGNADTTAGSLHLLDDMSLVETSRLDIHLGGATMGVNFTNLIVDGHVALGGTLSVALASDFMPALNDEFELILAAGLSGEFDALQLPELSADRHWDVVYGDDSFLLRIAANIVNLPGDFNVDGFVDAADYTVWRDGLESTFDQSHYVEWISNFGQSNGAGVATPLSVPEPPGLTVLLIAATFFAWRLQRPNRAQAI